MAARPDETALRGGGDEFPHDCRLARRLRSGMARAHDGIRRSRAIALPATRPRPAAPRSRSMQTTDRPDILSDLAPSRTSPGHSPDEIGDLRHSWREDGRRLAGRISVQRHVEACRPAARSCTDGAATGRSPRRVVSTSGPEGGRCRSRPISAGDLAGPRVAVGLAAHASATRRWHADLTGRCGRRSILSFTNDVPDILRISLSHRAPSPGRRRTFERLDFRLRYPAFSVPLITNDRLPVVFFCPYRSMRHTWASA